MQRTRSELASVGRVFLQESFSASRTTGYRPEAKGWSQDNQTRDWQNSCYVSMANDAEFDRFTSDCFEAFEDFGLFGRIFIDID